ncbi:MAG TPA: HAMP domain-containing sensor histidine kinase [Geobacteraceae bacterium]|nr:HAMP domain-containing sensor histidine kinase [Geobacteraceae bacterium]
MYKPVSEHKPRDGHEEEELLKRLAYNEKMAELGRLSAGIIHEINTPLSVIAAASQMVLCEPDLPEAVTEMVERIHLEVQRLSQLTRGILSFSGEEDGAEGESDVNLILREVLAFLKYEIQKRSVDVRLRPDSRLPLVNAQQNLLKQIFLNLIVNALHAMPDGGILYLDSCPASHKKVRVRVRDTGSGIPADVLEKIFTPFFTTKEPEVGTGLGLYVTKTSIEGLDGSIEVESSEGKGTCFTIFFPSV